MKYVFDYAKSLLDSPYLFNLFEKFAGVGSARKRFVDDYIAPFDGASVLDIGCGTGEILDYMPEHIKYVGFDFSQKYIEHAKNKYGSRGKFYCESVSSDINALHDNAFDFVFSLGVIHHLNEDEALRLISKAKTYLKPGGVFVTMDPVYVDGQSKISKFLIDNDRGEYVRNLNGYRELFLKVFKETDDCTVNDMLAYSYDHYITRSIKVAK
jgi:SAM-dependent methyltransferase